MTAAEEDWRELQARCERWLSGRRPLTAAAMLRRAADALDSEARPDAYGSGAVVEEFERRIADDLGLEAAVLMPSGTMAQQIALRLHCERRGTGTIAFHPTCHLQLHERAGYAHLHGLHAELVGDRDRLLTLEDLRRLPPRVGALLLELPQREIGGRLPEWEDLVAQTGWARERGIALHLDGARIWEAAPYYGRSHAEIAALFDTVYVSLYKALGGLAGSVLAGPAELMDEARVWRRRHGGELYRLFPLLAAALPGLAHTAPRMDELLAHARAIGAELAEAPGVSVVPHEPQTPLFHLHLHAEPDAVWERSLAVAREQRVWLINRPAPSILPGTAKVELSLVEPALQIAPAEAAGLLAGLVA